MKNWHEKIDAIEFVYNIFYAKQLLFSLNYMRDSIEWNTQAINPC